MLLETLTLTLQVPDDTDDAAMNELLDEVEDILDLLKAAIVIHIEAKMPSVKAEWKD